MTIIAWHWIDDRTMMVLADDLHWYRLENVYPQAIHFDGLDMSDKDDLTFTMPSVKYQPSS
jgi:hypothetical protein